MALVLTQDNYPERLGQLHAALNTWGKRHVGLIRQELIALGLDQRRTRLRGSSRLRRVTASSGKTFLAKDQYLVESLKYSIKRRGLVVDRVSISWARHGIFIDVGVGKNRRKGSGKESPQPWIASSMKNAVQELGDLLASEYADIAAGELRINIPGIYSTTISI